MWSPKVWHALTLLVCGLCFMFLGGQGKSCIDNDGDGYSVGNCGSGPEECGPVDCDDANPDVNPGAVEECMDGIDNDCDGLVDFGDGLDCTWGYSCSDATLANRNFEASIKLYIDGKVSPCWGHTARATFFTGKDGKYRFRRIEIAYATVEICTFVDSGSECSPADCYAGTIGDEYLPPSWPREGGMWCSPHGCPPSNGGEGTDTPWFVYIETSMDGSDWEEVAKVPFNWVKQTTLRAVELDDWREFRFMRVRQPDDVAGLTLAGYLDSVKLRLPDLEKVEDEGSIGAESGDIVLDASTSIDGIPIPGEGQKFLGMRGYASGVSRTEEEKICGNMGANLSNKYFWSSGNECVTWFSGWRKKWMFKQLDGTFTICRNRYSSPVNMVVQTSMDGWNWTTHEETDHIGPDGTFDLFVDVDEAIEARFVRVFVKPFSWGGGTISNGWINDAVFTLTSQ
ncbi:MopE-related protein [Thermodesulfobacteriota bacterium]